MPSATGRRIATHLVAAAVGFGVAYGIWRPHSPATEGLVGVRSDDLERGDAGAKVTRPAANRERSRTPTAEGPSPAVGGPTAAELEGPRDVPTLEARIAELRQSGSRDRREYMRLLEELIQNGPDGVAAVLDLMADDTFDFPHRASAFADLLMGVDDERVFPAALAVLRRMVADEACSSYSCDGYFDLVAARGGAEGARFILEQLAGGSWAAVESLRHLQDRTVWPELLEVCAEHPLAPEIFDHLADWEDPDLWLAVRASLRSAEATEGYLDGAFDAAWEVADADWFGQLAAHYWSPSSPESRRSCVQGLYGFISNPLRQDARFSGQVHSILVDAITSGDPGLQWGAVYVLGGDSDLGAVPEIAIALEQQYDSSPPGSLRAALHRALIEIRQAIARAENG